MNDITINEQATATITVYPTYADGTAVNLTNAGPGTQGSITWVAYNPSNQDAAQIKKDTLTMTIMIGPQLATTSSSSAVAAQKVVHFTKIETFGADSWGRPIPDLAPGDIVVITNEAGVGEFCEVATINVGSKAVTMVNNLSYGHESGNVITRTIPWFSFTLLEGDTILPATKVYGTPIIWQHMAVAKFPEGLSPENIYQEPTTLVLLRGRLFIDPILEMG